VASDASFPTQTVYLIHYDADPLRGVRYINYDDSIFDNRLRGIERVVRTNIYLPAPLGFQLGSQFGWGAVFSLPPHLFVPGAMADNLTSFGGYIFENAGQTSSLDYLKRRATASYGTVVEPCNYLEKFPSPRTYFYQARGFTVAESYYMSVTIPIKVCCSVNRWPRHSRCRAADHGTICRECAAQRHDKFVRAIHGRR